MKKVLKKITIGLLFNILCMLLIYSAISFVYAETNPFLWERSTRICLVVLWVMPISFTPLVVGEINN